MQRNVPTETFQPTAVNARRLEDLRRTKIRGERSRIINLAIDRYYTSFKPAEVRSTPSV